MKTTTIDLVTYAELIAFFSCKKKATKLQMIITTYGLEILKIASCRIYITYNVGGNSIVLQFPYRKHG